MISSRERLIILYIVLNNNSYDVYNLCSILNISDRTLRRSMDIINNFLSKIDKENYIHISNNKILLNLKNDEIINKIKIDDFYEYSKKEMALIFANSLLFSSITNFSSYLTLFKVSKSYLNSIIDDLKIIFTKQNIKIINNVNNYYVSHKDLVSTKRIQLNLLNDYLSLLPENAIIKYENFLPSEVSIIIESWLGRESFKHLHKNISNIFKNSGRFINFYDIFYLCMILILWKDFGNNEKVLNSDSFSMNSLSTKITLLDLESEIFNKYFYLSKETSNKVKDSLFKSIIKFIETLYKPFNSDRIIALSRDIYFILQNENPKTSLKKYENYSQNINEQSLKIIHENILKILEEFKLDKDETSEYISFELTKNIYYWLLEQVTIDPFNILFIQNDSTTIVNFYISLLSNTFCCINLNVINIYEYNVELLKNYNIVLTQFKIDNKSKNLIDICDNNAFTNFIYDIQNILIDNVIKKFSDH